MQTENRQPCKLALTVTHWSVTYPIQRNGRWRVVSLPLIWPALVLVVLQWSLYRTRRTVGAALQSESQPEPRHTNVPLGEEASHPHHFPYIHLSTFIIQEYKTTQSNLSSYKDSLAHPSAAHHIKDSFPLFREQRLEDDTQYVCIDCS